MSKTKNTLQKNRNNKTKPQNLMKKEYLESLDILIKSIQKNQNRLLEWLFFTRHWFG